MALLDDLLAGMLGGATNQQPAGRQPTSGGMGRQVPAAAGGMGGVLMALLPVVLSMLATPFIIAAGYFLALVNRRLIEPLRLRLREATRETPVALPAG